MKVFRHRALRCARSSRLAALALAVGATAGGREAGLRPKPPTLLRPGAALHCTRRQGTSRGDAQLLHRPAGRVGAARRGRVHEALGRPGDVDTVRHGGAPGPLRRRGRPRATHVPT